MTSVSFSLIGVLAYSFGLSFFNSIYISMFLPVAFVILLRYKIFVHVLKKLVLLNIFIIIVCLSAFWQNQYELALLIFLRSNALLIFMLLLFWDKSLFDIALGLQKLKAPDKVVALFFFVAKFIYIIKEELVRIQKVMKSRGFESKSDVFTYKSYANVIGILIIKCFWRAEKLKNIMQLRGFDGVVYQSQSEKITPNDFFIFTLILFAIFARIGEIQL